MRTQAWTAARDRDVDAMLRVARSPSADGETLMVLCPPVGELDQLPVGVALAIVEHSQCPGGLADRLARHPSAAVRLAVIRRGRCGAMAEAILLADPDGSVRAAAQRAFGT
ncbi:MAG: hypothetical protein B7X41_07055 [Microbacterium sp. 14-71-5]|jgi:hypothetical protein|nr:MAG: hypothetical protein B7X41_07055 [Microbacterium sp. 14-71-5]